MFQLRLVSKKTKGLKWQSPMVLKALVCLPEGPTHPSMPSKPRPLSALNASQQPVTDVRPTFHMLGSAINRGHRWQILILT